MATSTVTIYSAGPNNLWELLPHKLLVVESITGYLNNKTHTTISNFQYLKPQLELSITVDLSQTNAEPLNSSFKYVSFYNSDDTDHIYYYFVNNVIWRSKASVRFDLVMDVLNTFKETRDYTFKENTRIIREHKNRYVQKNRSYTFTNLNLVSSAGGVNVTDEVYITNTAIFATPVLKGVLTALSATSFTIFVATGGISKQELQTFINASAQASVPIALVKNSSNYAFFAPNLTFTLTCDTFRNIDYVNENINPLLQCKSAAGEKMQNSKSILQGDWYLLYRNQNNPTDSLVNPVECYLIPDKNINTDSGYIENGRLIPSFIQEGKYYYFKITNNQATLSNGVSLSYPTTGRQILLVTKAGGVLSVTHFFTGSLGSEVIVYHQYDGIEYITFTGLPIPYRIENTFLDTGTNEYYNLQNDMPYNFNNSGTENQLDKITLLDRTDAKNIKLIKLPYCPFNFTVSGTTLQVGTKWDYVSLSQSGGGIINCLKLKDLNTDLHASFTLSSDNINPLKNLKMTSFSVGINNLRKDSSFESKLFNSEFYRGTYVYDSFSYVVQLEKLEIDSYLSGTDLTVYFDMTKTINSRFMFTFNTLDFKIAVESYAKYLPIARNNEEVLYNVPYINYIRNGFNYDVKSKNLSNASNWLGAGLSVAGVALSLALPTAPLKALGVASSLISMAMTAKNAITTTIQNEENLQRKLTEAKNQTASVAGSDDVDLMSIYAENRLKYLVYEPNPIMKEMLNNLFFYAGYASNRLGKPTHDNRINFDYLEADVVLDKISNIPDECVTELVNAFKNGVTYMHYVSDRTSNKWDFAQQYENWEKDLI